MTTDENNQARRERNNLAELTKLAGLTAQVKTHLHGNFREPQLLVEYVNKHGWPKLRKSVPGLGNTYAGRLYEVLVAAGYKVREFIYVR